MSICKALAVAALEFLEPSLNDDARPPWRRRRAQDRRRAIACRKRLCRSRAPPVAPFRSALRKSTTASSVSRQVRASEIVAAARGRGGAAAWRGKDVEDFAVIASRRSRQWRSSRGLSICARACGNVVVLRRAPERCCSESDEGLGHAGSHPGRGDRRARLRRSAQTARSAIS